MGPAATVDETVIGEGDVESKATDDGVTNDVAPADAKHTRPYKVLRFDDDDVNAFSLVGEFVAHGDKQAISLAGDEHGEGRYVAVAVTHWHERTAVEKPQPTVLVVE